MTQPIDDIFMNEKEEEFEFFRNFMNVEEAQAFTALLEASGILYKLETTGMIIDSVIVGDGLLPKAILKVQPKDFKKINQIIADQLNAVDYSEIDDHYLTQLDDKELQEIFLNQDDWSPEDIIVAKLILRQRGIAVSEEEIEQLREERFNEIRAGKEGNTLSIVLYSLGIIFGLITTPIFIIAGIGMGWYYAYGKNNDPDGNKYFVFAARTRQIGTAMFYGGIVFIIMEILFFEDILEWLF